MNKVTIELLKELEYVLRRNRLENVEVAKSLSLLTLFATLLQDKRKDEIVRIFEAKGWYFKTQMSLPNHLGGTWRSPAGVPVISSSDVFLPISTHNKESLQKAKEENLPADAERLYELYTDQGEVSFGEAFLKVYRKMVDERMSMKGEPLTGMIDNLYPPEPAEIIKVEFSPMGW